MYGEAGLYVSHSSMEFLNCFFLLKFFAKGKCPDFMFFVGVFFMWIALTVACECFIISQSYLGGTNS